MNGPFVPHCGACGWPTCKCQQAANTTVLPPRIKHGFYLVCSACKLAADYCACGKQPPPPPPTGDGDESNLIARIRALKGAP